MIYRLEDILFFAVIGLALLAQSMVTNSYRRFARIENGRNLTGAQAARDFLQRQGVRDVEIVPINGFLNDHYDPTTKTIRLSKDNYYGNTISAVSIAAHEAGHAIQHAENYAMLVLRNKMIPTVNFANRMLWVVIIGGLLLSIGELVLFGAVLFAVIAVFQLVTLPVEFDASKRALAHLDESVLTQEETSGAKKVLFAAALTYVVALLTSIVQVARFLTIFAGGRRR
jgi:Zn-dependent membrane protease YugP